ncbi:MAG TPA: PhoH family protein [Acidimicrobiales bacterium]|nr:PhoH family protein [Acidimicrobiales bacterium]
MSTTPSTTPGSGSASDGGAVKVLVPGNHLMVGLLGHRDELLRLVEAAFPSTRIFVRGNEISIEGAQPDADAVGRLFGELVTLLEQGHALDLANVGRTIEMVKAGEKPTEILTADILRSARGRMVRPKTSGQKRYVDAISKNIITFGIGPAGTGKSYLAVALACQALQRKEVERIILTRPAVEAGERLGFLPGDLMAKVDPYLRPLYDALFDMLGTEAVPKLMEKGAIEVAPLAYMRGRAQPVDIPVLTPDGFVPIGELQVGDLVIGANGLPTPVIGVYPQGRKTVYRVATQDGAATYACGDHLWMVRTPDDARRGKPGRVVRTEEMIGNLRIVHQRRYELPLVREVEFEPQPVPIDPYALGLLLGDGCLTTATTPSFTTADAELAQALDALLPASDVVRKSRHDYVLARAGGGRGAAPNPVTAAVRELGLAGTRSNSKFVPYQYLFNTSAVRLAVLQGLLDSDGGPVRQSGRSCRIEYTTTSAALRDDVTFLVRSLGGVAYVRTRDAHLSRPGGTSQRPARAQHDSFRLDIRLPAHIKPFRLKRKADRYAEVGGGRPMRFIDSIEEAGEAECVCIAVAAPDSLYVTSDFLVTHNTLNSSFIILDEAQNTTPEQMKMFLTRIGFGSKCVVTGDVTQIDLDGGKSGLINLEPILQGIEDLEFVRLGAKDVVRHRIVAEIVDAYDRARASGMKA